MNTTPAQKVTAHENTECFDIESSNKESAAFILHVSTEHFRRDQTPFTQVEIKLPRHLYRRLASEDGLRELKRLLLLQEELKHLAGRLVIFAKKQLGAQDRFQYFIVFALDDA